jgi:hypothetical protein
MFSFRNTVFSSKNAIDKNIAGKTSYLPKAGLMISNFFIFSQLHIDIYFITLYYFGKLGNSRVVVLMQMRLL